MDEGLLNDLLECSVCLERLDTSSRVLPCQHTFCIKCLKEIVKSHKELRCPECRVLVETKVEDLPPNVLLMRILESMKHTDHKRIAHHHTPNSSLMQSRIAQMHHQNAQNQRGTQANSADQPAKIHQTVPQPVVPHALAVYDYISKEPGDLSFKKGEVIMLRRKLDSHWYQGECGGKGGIFPISYVQVLVPLPNVMPQCKALYDFRMTAPDEEGCLIFEKGAVITVIRRVDENWAEGKLNERIGIFPIAFVEMNIPARALMKLSTQNSGRAVPPTPAESNSTPLRQFPLYPQSQTAQCYQQMTQSSPMSAPMHTSNQPMSQSHPSYHHSQAALQVGVASHAAVTPSVNSHRIHLDLKQPMTDLIQLAQQTQIKPISIGTATVSGQGLNILIGGTESQDSRMRLLNTKFSNIVPAQTQHYQTLESTISGHPGLKHYPSLASYNTSNSTDSSSTNTTPSFGVSSATTTPNSSSNTSSASDSTEPSSPTSPPNRTEDNAPLVRVPETAELPQTTDARTTTAPEVPPLRTSNSPTKPKIEAPPQPSFQSYINRDQPEEGFFMPKNLSAPSTSKPSAYLPPTANGIALKQGFDQLVAQARSLHSHHREREREREKRHSLTPSGNQSQSINAQHNRHSAEILETGILEQPIQDTSSKREGSSRGRTSDKDKNRRRSRSNEDPLPTAYIALYPYKPQKKDELELKKGSIYMVLERCRDGWYKGLSNRTNKCGVFPGNYVITTRHAQQLATQVKQSQNASSALRKADTKLQSQGQETQKPQPQCPVTYRDIPTNLPPPDLPPRSQSPTPLGGSSSQPAFVWTVPSQFGQPPGQIIQTVRPDKSKENKPSKPERSVNSASTGVSLMKRLAAMKKCKSPPPSGYSMDNPVFEDSSTDNCSGGSDTATNATTSHHPVHVRSGSCPSQLLQGLPPGEGPSIGGSVSSAVAQRLFGGSGSASAAMASSHRLKGRGKERPSVLAVLGSSTIAAHPIKQHSRLTNESSGSQTVTGQHRKSQSLDAGSSSTAAAIAVTPRPKQSTNGSLQTQHVKEKFRCVVAYPANSPYELELRVGDIVVVSRKRGDGWYKGTHQRSGRIGLFPASFVEPCPD